jgi:hypothetical protein
MDDLFDPANITKITIPASDIIYDKRICRGLNEAWIARALSAYDPAHLGIICVSRRTDGTVVILDGLQRCELKKRAEGDAALITCLAWSGLTLQEEAQLFIYLNSDSTVYASGRLQQCR